MTPEEQHVAQIKDRLEGLEEHACLLFACACAERQWPIVKRVCLPPNCDKYVNLLRSNLDAIWDYLLGKGTFDSIVDISEEFSDTADTNPLCREIIVCHIFLADLVMSVSESHSVYISARRNFYLIDVYLDLLDDIDGAPFEATGDGIELRRREQERQLADLAILERDAPLIDRGMQLRNESIGKTIL